jgi:hypothetical protein
MHGHVHGVGTAQVMQSQTMASLEKAAALRQAAAVRRSLLKAAARELDGALDDEGVGLVEAWHEQGAGSGERRRGYARLDDGTGEAASGKVSYWV